SWSRRRGSRLRGRSTRVGDTQWKAWQVLTSVETRDADAKRRAPQSQQIDAGTIRSRRRTMRGVGRTSALGFRDVEAIRRSIGDPSDLPHLRLAASVRGRPATGSVHPLNTLRLAEDAIPF